MKNKKAQMGKIITSLPVMLLIVVIMGIFIFLSAAASLFNSETFDAAASINPEDSLLLKNIQIQKDNKITEMPVLDACYEYYKKNIKRDELIEQLKKLVTEKNSCLGITIGETPNPSKYSGLESLDYFLLILEKNGKVSVGHPGSVSASVTERYQSRLDSAELTLKDKKLYIDYYLGACANE